MKLFKLILVLKNDVLRLYLFAFYCNPYPKQENGKNAAGYYYKLLTSPSYTFL